MAIPFFVFQKFWSFVGKSDAKRIASQSPPAGVTTIDDLPYLDDGKKAHLLDIYAPQDADGPLPLIIDVHGGGWLYGYKEINRYYGMFLASQGYRVISVNYTLSPEGKIPDQIRDLFDAFGWIDRHGADYGCDMRNVYLTGDSAGGHLAAIAAALTARGDLREVYGVQAPSFSFNAVGFVCGAFDVDFLLNLRLARTYAEAMMGKNYERSRFYRFVSMSDLLNDPTGYPPVWMVSSKEDFIGFLSDRFDRLLSRCGVAHEYKKWGRSKAHALPHVFCVTNPEYAESIASNCAMLAFFERYRK